MPGGSTPPRDAAAPNSASLLRVHLALLAVQLAFSGFHVIAKLLFSELHPLALVAVRVVGAAPLLFVFAWRHDRVLPRWRDLPSLALLGLLGVCLNQVLFVLGLERTRLSGLAGAGIAAHEPLVRALNQLDPPADGFAATGTLTATGGVTVALDTRGAIDVAAERARLEKDLAAAEQEAAQCRARLANDEFLAKAPDRVVARVKDRLATAEADLARITAARDALPG